MGKARPLWDSAPGHSPSQTRKVHSLGASSLSPALPSAGDVQEKDLEAWANAMLDHLKGDPEGLGEPVRELWACVSLPASWQCSPVFLLGTWDNGLSFLT